MGWGCAPAAVYEFLILFFNFRIYIIYYKYISILIHYSIRLVRLFGFGFVCIRVHVSLLLWVIYSFFVKLSYITNKFPYPFVNPSTPPPLYTFYSDLLNITLSKHRILCNSANKFRELNFQ